MPPLSLPHKSRRKLTPPSTGPSSRASPPSGPSKLGTWGFPRNSPRGWVPRAVPQQRLREGYGVRGCHRRRLWSKTGDMAFTLRCLVTNHPKPAGPTSTSTRSNLPHQPTNLQIRARLPRSSRPTTERRMAGSPSRPHHTSTMLWIRRGAPLPGSQSYATATPHLPTRVAPNTAEGTRRWP